MQNYSCVCETLWSCLESFWILAENEWVFISSVVWPLNRVPSPSLLLEECPHTACGWEPHNESHLLCNTELLCFFFSVALNFSPWIEGIAIRAVFTSYISVIHLLLWCKARLIIWNRPATTILITFSCKKVMQGTIFH